jgi:ADP-ribose pyrophosphatase YjhB (NUDIX family)
MDKNGRIRAIAICVFRHKGRILAGEGFDSRKQERFYRPLGGTIEFGEHARDTVIREIREELGQEITGIKPLGVLENLFTCEGMQGHEIVFVFDAQFADPSLYGLDVIHGNEPDLIAEGKDTAFRAVWVSESPHAARPGPLYPDGLLELLAANP